MNNPSSDIGYHAPSPAALQSVERPDESKEAWCAGKPATASVAPLLQLETWCAGKPATASVAALLQLEAWYDGKPVTASFLCKPPLQYTRKGQISCSP
jgi:hypothetical protein